jgi:hypothetical protein
LNINTPFLKRKADESIFYETKANPDNLPYGNRTLTIGHEPGDPPVGIYITNPYRLGSMGLEVKFPVNELQEDFLKVRQTLEENHSCLYAFTSKEEFDSLFDHYLEHEPVPYFAEPYGRYAEFANPIPLTEKRFTGNLYTLLDGRCFSTNGHFCALLKYHKIGKFIGTGSGATYTCNAGRDLMVRLNNTRFMLYFGRTPFAVAVEGMNKREPIKPDYPVHETIQDMLDGRDLYMETALKLIERGEQ